MEELQKRLEEPGFWDDPEVSQQVMKELKGLEDSVKEIEKLYSDYEDMLLLIEMSEEESDEDTTAEIEEELAQFEEKFEELRIGTLLTGPYDRAQAKTIGCLQSSLTNGTIPQTKAFAAKRNGPKQMFIPLAGSQKYRIA